VSPRGLSGGNRRQSTVSRSPVLNGVTFSGNTTDNDIGGAMEDYGNSYPVLTNVTFSGNGSNLHRTVS